MAGRVTIRDIALLAGVSSGTVHRALYGKKGVGEEVRARVLAIARQQGFTLNTAASALKRGPLRIAACFPAPQGEDRYFYTDVWQGLRDYFAEEAALNLTLLEYPFAEGGQAAALAAAMGETAEEAGAAALTGTARPAPPARPADAPAPAGPAGPAADAPETAAPAQIGTASQAAPAPQRPDGLLTLGLASTDPAPRALLQRCGEQGLPVVLACDDAPGCPRLACVQANYDTIGRLGAELLASQLPANSTVLLLAGDAATPSHLGVARGFAAYLAEQKAPLRLIELPGYRGTAALQTSLARLLTETPVAGALSVNSRGSVLLAQAIQAAGLAGKIRLVGSDLFPENIAAMRAGVMHNILYKNPRQQAYQAARLLVQHLLRPDAPPPAPAETEIEAQVLFRSGLYRYE